MVEGYLNRKAYFEETLLVEFLQINLIGFRFKLCKRHLFHSPASNVFEGVGNRIIVLHHRCLYVSEIVYASRIPPRPLGVWKLGYLEVKRLGDWRTRGLEDWKVGGVGIRGDRRIGGLEL